MPAVLQDLTVLVPQSPAGEQDNGVVHSIYHRFEEAAEVREAWDSLASREGDLHCSYDWCEAWWRHYGRGRHLEIHVVRLGQELVGVVPLFRESLWLGAAGLRVVQLVGCDHAVTPPGLAIRPDVTEQVLTVVLAGLPAGGAWDVLHLGPLRPYIASVCKIATACSESPAVGTVIVSEHEDCVSVFDLPRTYEEYLANLRPSERRNILRCERNLAAAHKVEITPAQTRLEVRRAIDALMRLHQDLWIGRGQPGQFGEMPELEAFHRDIIGRMRCQDRLILVTLKIDGQIQGVEYACRFGPRVYPLFRGYCDAPAWRSYSLGRMLHCHTIREAIRQGVRMADDGRGPYEYKRRLGARLECERSITVLRRGWLVRAHFWLALWISRLRHAVYRRQLPNRLRSRIGLAKQLLPDRYIRSLWLAHLLWRTGFRLASPHKVEKARCMCNSPLCPYGDSGAVPAGCSDPPAEALAGCEQEAVS